MGGGKGVLWKGLLSSFPLSIRAQESGNTGGQNSMPATQLSSANPGAQGTELLWSVIPYVHREDRRMEVLFVQKSLLTAVGGSLRQETMPLG